MDRPMVHCIYMCEFYGMAHKYTGINLYIYLCWIGLCIIMCVLLKRAIRKQTQVEFNDQC